MCDKMHPNKKASEYRKQNLTELEREVYKPTFDWMHNLCSQEFKLCSY